MSKEGAGTRIRARRLERGLTQAALATEAGISASYLNLIEHGRRRVGGAVLGRIAQALGSDPAVLSNGAAADVLQALDRAAGGGGSRQPDTALPERFAAEFPGWADLIVRQTARIDALEAQRAAMADRMAHDPALSASVHDVLSVVTAIRSTAAILAADDPLEPEWQQRFHRNIHEDSQRLAQSAQGLASYLADGRRGDEPQTPAEEVEAWLAARDHDPDQNAVPDQEMSAAGRAALERYLADLRRDRAALKPGALADAFVAAAGDPFATADALGADVGLVLRSLARLPRAAIGPVGLVECDGAGAILHRRTLPGFAMPQSAVPCALWPVFQALLSPGHPRRDVVRQIGRDARPVVAWSVASLSRAGGVTGPLVARATMLLRPAPAGQDAAPTLGPTCRLCSVADCDARREASIL